MLFRSEIVRSQGVGEVDGVYCSFMPQEVDSVRFIKEIHPKVIVYVFEKSGDNEVGSIMPVLDVGEGYEIYAFSTLISYRDLHYLDSLHPSILATGFVIQVRRNANKPGRLRSFFQRIGQQDLSQQKYAWETELDQKLAEVRKMAQEEKG